MVLAVVLARKDLPVDQPSISVSFGITNGGADRLADSVTIHVPVGDLRDDAILLAVQLTGYCQMAHMDKDGNLPPLPAAPYLDQMGVTLDPFAAMTMLADRLYLIVEIDVLVGQRRVLWLMEPAERQLVADALNAFQLVKTAYLSRVRQAMGSENWCSAVHWAKRDYSGLSQQFLNAQLPTAPKPAHAG